MVDGWAGFRLHSKLKLLRGALRQWNREIFGDVTTKLKVVEDELHELDLLAKNRDLVEAEKARRREVSGEAWKLSRWVKWMWLQKARLDWTLKGDRNTRCFHIMATSKQSRNGLNSVMVGDRVCEDPVEIKQKVCRHFMNHFAKKWRNRPTLDGNFGSVRLSQNFELLKVEISEEEIWAAIKNREGNKAPDPDGFNLPFDILLKAFFGEAMVDRWAEFRLHSKLKLLRGALRQWNREIFGDVTAKLKAVEDELHELDLLAKNRDVVEAEKARRREVSGEAWKLSRWVKWMWLQKARLDWTLKGDRNT
ncbi:uncharacterized protein LOC114313755 [Camellia sinensis]|uniref:uncharacterized protein LOC114313755 n=1 Tax=Camellia sinensis TaxID=4442 RepID=UPI00103627DE|nr:uncharacterized protein LOC114313755 [Camellia sinensis]